MLFKQTSIFNIVFTSIINLIYP